MKPDRRTVQFVRAVLATGGARRTGDLYRCQRDKRPASLAAATVDELVSQGVLVREGDRCRPAGQTRTWMKRQMADADQYAAQHRVTAAKDGGTARNLAESPLARLAQPAGGHPSFLEPHQVEAGERFRHLVERAHMMQRTTMSYDPTRTVSAPGGGGRSGGIADMGLDARRELSGLLSGLPRDCAGVLLDICGFLKGLQQVEHERGWPRRSAKLVLRIALEHLAGHYGLTATATGPQSGRPHAWVPEDALPTEVG